ncbi:SMEK domain-containing protein [Aquidulcibacter paucihalophilus]|uniref:SMEK domain-containing protein n=1 Tax=Aquidulcibacter paucihalophilus TaxID=1978549 RepID=UPI000A196961|nr:SMEK domain-containing protein [Aquidulcibacter paucihalophilus]
MNRDGYLNSVAQYLGRLVHEIRALNAVGRFDVNSVAEDFLIPVLKLVFDCPDLQNMNKVLANYPAVDLGCATTRFSFQVTTDGSSSKVEKTLEKFHEHGLGKTFDRLYVLALTGKQASYKAKSLQQAIAAVPIAFDPTENVIDWRDILTRIRHLETEKLEAIDRYLGSGWAKRDGQVKFREQLDKFLAFSAEKIEVERKSRKYIPAIFVETHSTKEQMRLFANPLFFYRKIQDLLRRFSYDHLNSNLQLAGEPELVSELNASLLDTTPSTFVELGLWLDQVDQMISVELAKVRPISWYRETGESRYEPVNPESAGWMIARLKVEGAASGLTSRLNDARALIGLIRNKIFLITSMAGQGKTNFVCDLVESQFRLFEIPCLFIPARQLNGFAPGTRLFNYIAHNRYAPDGTKLHDYLKLFDQAAHDVGKPFVILIDGINEVTELASFNEELKAFCSAVCQYDRIKLVITCRSEFFDERFASILDEPFAAHIHRVNDLRSEMTDLSKARLLRAYLTHFNIKGSLQGQAKVFLANDLLLLRIFCERFEGGDVGYVSDIYKGDLFYDYLRMKIESFPKHLQPTALPTLLKIAASMLAADNFSKVSVRNFSAEEQEIVRRFIEDDVILRQEVDSEGLAAVGDLAISFTYDELRDFIIAYQLIDRAGADQAQALTEMLARLPSHPVYEGVYRYAYLLARRAKDISAIAACEAAPNFIEHFSLNVHLLPPAVQTSEDVARVKAILGDAGDARRRRRVALFLLHRLNAADLLNIAILIGQLNDLEDAEHASFIRAIFGGHLDYDPFAWRQRINELVMDVGEDEGGQGLVRYTPQWLAFFLHSAAHAGWFERERASTLFQDAGNADNGAEALMLVARANAKAVQSLLADIAAPVGDSK